MPPEDLLPDEEQEQKKDRRTYLILLLVVLLLFLALLVLGWIFLHMLPPGWLFGPVWSALYALMGVAAWLVWRSPVSTKVALGLFGAQLAFNALWSWLFFAWHRGALATAEVLILLVLIMATVAAFWRTSRLAALLLMPYLLWVSFASVLTWAVWRSNPGLL